MVVTRGAANQAAQAAAGAEEGTSLRPVEILSSHSSSSHEGSQAGSDGSGNVHCEHLFVFTSERNVPRFDELKDIFTQDWAAAECLLDNNVVSHPGHCLRCDGPVTFAKRHDLEDDPAVKLTANCCILRCNKRRCTPGHPRFQRSVFDKTFFATARVRKSKIMHFLWLWCQRTKPSAMENTLGWSAGTAADWCACLRELIIQVVNHPGDDWMIGGPGIEVQIDEAKFGKRKHNRGHRVEGTWVFGGVERIWDPAKQKWNAGNWFAIPVARRDRPTLWGIVEAKIRPGAKIISDGFSTCKNLQNWNDHTHFTVEHDKHFKDPETGVHTNVIEGHWAVLKGHIDNRSCNDDMMHDCLCEEMWRSRHKGRIWDALLEVISQTRWTQEAGCCLASEVDDPWQEKSSKKCASMRAVNHQGHVDVIILHKKEPMTEGGLTCTRKQRQFFV